MVDWRANLEIFSAVGVLGISLLLLAIALVSYGRLRSPRALLVGLGFLVLAVKGAYLTVVSWGTRGSQDWVLTTALLDLALALLLYFAIRKG